MSLRLIDYLMSYSVDLNLRLITEWTSGSDNQLESDGVLMYSF